MNHRRIGRSGELLCGKGLAVEIDVDPVLERVIRRSGWRTAALFRRWRWWRSAAGALAAAATKPGMRRPGRGGSGPRSFHRRRSAVFPHRHAASRGRGRDEDAATARTARIVFRRRITDRQLLHERNRRVVGAGRNLVHAGDRIAEQSIDPELFLGEHHLHRRWRLLPVERRVNPLLIFGAPDDEFVGANRLDWLGLGAAGPSRGRDWIDHHLIGAHAGRKLADERPHTVLISLEELAWQLAIGLQCRGPLNEVVAERGRPDTKRLLALPKLLPFGECLSLDGVRALVDLL